MNLHTRAAPVPHLCRTCAALPIVGGWLDGWMGGWMERPFVACFVLKMRALEVDSSTVRPSIQPASHVLSFVLFSILHPLISWFLFVVL